MLILIFMFLRRAHGSKFYGLFHNNTVKRALITSLMTAACFIEAGSGSPYILALIPLFWLWLGPGTHISPDEWELSCLRELYALPAIIFYAFYCQQPYLAFLSLLWPLAGLSYKITGKMPGDPTKYAELLLGALMGIMLTAIAMGELWMK